MRKIQRKCKNLKCYLNKFYELINKLEKFESIDEFLKSEQKYSKGVYFFFDPAEKINNGYNRIIRVGSHGLSGKSNSTLKGRLRQHKGFLNGGGNRRVSVFRRHVGNAIIKKENFDEKEVQDEVLEKMISDYINSLPLAVLLFEDDADKRRIFEKNSIRILSNCSENFNKDWLGSFSIDEKISKSGLWNIQHVNINNEKYNNETKVEINNFLNELEILTKM